MESDPQRPVNLEHYKYRDTSSRPQQSVEGHSLTTQHGHYDAIQEEAAQRQYTHTDYTQFNVQSNIKLVSWQKVV